MPEDEVTIADVIASIASPEVKDLVFRMTRAVIIECMTQVAVSDLPDAKRGVQTECFGMLYHRVNAELINRMPVITTNRGPRWGPPPKV